MIKDRAKKLMLKAADLIEERGWSRDRYVTEDGALCVISALRVADGRDAMDSSEDTINSGLLLLKQSIITSDPIAATNLWCIEDWNHTSSHQAVVKRLRNEANAV